MKGVTMCWTELSACHMVQGKPDFAFEDSVLTAHTHLYASVQSGTTFARVL